jgi:DNA-binding transcriptional LysR family regulator
MPDLNTRPPRGSIDCPVTGGKVGCIPASFVMKEIWIRHQRKTIGQGHKMNLREYRNELDWDDLRFVLAIERAGSLSAGARRLGIDHSTAFRRMNAIESRLGVRLFERARSGYAPTEAGEAAALLAGEIEARVDDLTRRLAGADLSPSGTVRLTTTDTLAPVLAPMLAGFRRLHPGIIVELIVANGFFTLTRRDAEIALRPAAAAPDGLVARRVGEVATAFYEARGSSRPESRLLAELDWLAPEDSLSHLASSRWLARMVPPERIVARADSLAALALLCRAGLGVAPLPCIVGDHDPGLQRLGPPDPGLVTGLWLVTHPDLRQVRRIRTLLDHLAEELRRLRPALAGTG